MNPLSMLRHSWNTFATEVDRHKQPVYSQSESYYNPSRRQFSRGNERTIVTSVYNRLSIDCASISLKHVRLDQNGRFEEEIVSGLNNCLTVEANVDQTASNFIQDIVISMLDEGCVAVVPVDTNIDPTITNGFDITSMRTGKIIAWYPMHVKVELYNEQTGRKENVTLPKNSVAIIENPLYAVINEPNSTMQRLIRKLAHMDNMDENISSGAIDLLIQLPYSVKSEARKALADQRRNELEAQLNGAKYGIGYIDGTEKITQLNRSVNNNFMKEIEYLTNLLFSQLGLTQGILDGTADENTMTNYFSRTIEPIIGAIVDEFHRKFLSKTARSQRQAIQYFRDPFKLIPVSDISEIADKFTRNEIMSSNEIRQIVGMRPSTDPKADELRNKNLSQSKEELDAEQQQEMSDIISKSKKEEKQKRKEEQINKNNKEE